MPAWIKRVSEFLRLVDEQGQLSLTNITVYVVLFKIYQTENVSLLDAGALLVALLGYNGKKVLKYFNDKKQVLAADEANEIKQRLKELHDKVGAVAAATNMNKLR